MPLFCFHDKIHYMIKVLILGGGFGGIRCALGLSKKFSHSTSSGQEGQVQIALVDRNSYHLFLPSLYEVASICGIKKDPFAVKIRETICIPYGKIFSEKNINFIQAEISTVDLKSKSIRTKGDEVLPYDYLVIALGSQTADFGILGVREYAYQFKNINDAIAINEKIEKLIKKISFEEKMSPLKILIGGAGFTGVELAAEISCYVNKMYRKNRIRNRRAEITLIEAGSKILSMVSENERRIIYKRLTELGVVLMENSPIEEVGTDFVKLKSGQTLEGDMIIWTAGIKANDFLRSIIDLPLTEKGKIIIDENLQIEKWKNVFAVGDNQEFIDPKTQKPVPALAYTAVDQGKVVAENIYNLLNGKKLKKYKPFYGVWIAPVGGKFALAHLWGGWLVTGFMGWLVRGLVDLRYLISILSFRKAINIFWQEITMFTKND